MTKAKKDEALSLYFSRGLEMEEIALALGEPLHAVIEALSDPKLLRPYAQRSQAAKLRAQICVNERAEEAARKQAELIALGVEAKEHAVSQRAAKDILDRAGVCTGAETSREIRVVFEGMPKLGMPRGKGGETP